MDLNELTYIIRGAIFEVNRVLGAGFLVNIKHPKAEIKRFIL